MQGPNVLIFAVVINVDKWHASFSAPGPMGLFYVYKHDLKKDWTKKEIKYLKIAISFISYNAILIHCLI